MVEVYDIETLKGAFTYTGIDIKTRKISQFVLHKSRTDLHRLVSHLKFNVKGQIGFNNLVFDYPILHYILSNYNNWHNLSIESQIGLIYSRAQAIIEEQNKEHKAKVYNIREKDMIIPQLDLFKIWHYNNKAKFTSLKALQISMNYPTVVDMPISHEKEDITLDDLETILYYNLNDVLATETFYQKSIEKIELRKLIRTQYNLPCLNWNNGKIGEQLILKLYCEATGKNPYEVKQLRSPREVIKLKECIPENVKFTHFLFNSMRMYFEKKEITNTKDSGGFSVFYKNTKYVYGTGGIHGCTKAGLYESNDDYIIKSCDVSSLYPSLAIVYNLYPEHLGKEFVEIYKKNIVDVRLAEKAKGKDGNKVIVDGFKEAANIPYGKSNEATSFLYDPLYTMKTTVAGQLLLTMLAERLASIDDSQILMINTDGLEIRIPKPLVHEYDKICEQWQKETKLQLEFVDYQKMWIADVNNYGAMSVDGKIKSKGRFEVDKKLGNEPAYHKDNSFRIIPLAIQEFFSKGIPPTNTIYSNKDIYNFCGRQKFRGKDYGTIKYVRGNDYVTEYTTKNTRYYISRKVGGVFTKNYAKDGSSEVFHKGYFVTQFNNYVEKSWSDYNINYNFYLKEANKEIDNILCKQLTMNLDV